MKILIAGGTGFIGQALGKHYLRQGMELIIVGRDKEKINHLFPNKTLAISWDEFAEQGKDLLLISDLVINLAGANIAAKRWTRSRKREISESRIFTTKLIAQHCATLGVNSPPLFNASALSIYGLQQDVNAKPFTETSFISKDASASFSSQLIKDWESATHSAAKEGVRVINMRFAMVLAKQGLLSKLYKSYKLGLGGIIGSGTQPFPWIALFDLIQAIEFLFKNPTIKGPVNFIAPQCITQAQFAKTYAKVLHRSLFLKIPSPFLRIMLGEMAEELLLNGQFAYPEVLLSNNFKFRFSDITDALNYIYKSSNERPDY